MATPLEHWPRLTRFYGISPFELQNLPTNITRLYIKALPGLEAEEMLDHIRAVQLHHTSEANQRQTFRTLQMLAGISEDVEQLDPDEDADVYAGLGIKVVRG